MELIYAENARKNTEAALQQARDMVETYQMPEYIKLMNNKILEASEKGYHIVTIPYEKFNDTALGRYARDIFIESIRGIVAEKGYKAQYHNDRLILEW